MLGCGHKKPCRFLQMPQSPPESSLVWTTLDVNPNTNPDVLFDLDTIEHGNPLPFVNDYFDEIHAYEVMEHYGRQGDYRGFFTGMAELWRILKPNGYLFGTSPGMRSVWAWGDPGHTRAISAEMFSYLTLEMYRNPGDNAASDYSRLVNPCWWDLGYDQDLDDHIHFTLRKLSPVQVQ